MGLGLWVALAPASVPGGDAAQHFPWAWKESELVGVRIAGIDVDHTRRRQRLLIRDRVSVSIRGRYTGSQVVSCVIPGHDRSGEELVADELRIEDGPLKLEYRGTCGYGSTFAYAYKQSSSPTKRASFVLAAHKRASLGVGRAL